MDNNMSGEITSNILEYLLGGHCSFTLSQDSVGGRPSMKRRYSISESNETYFAYSLEGGKKYLGYFRRSDLGKLQSLRVKSKVAEGDEGEARPLIVILNSLKNRGVLPGDGVVHVISDGKCSVCGRKLTDVASIHYGIGPTCRKKIGL